MHSPTLLPAAWSIPAPSPQALAERVMMDALSTHLGVDEAVALFERILPHVAAPAAIEHDPRQLTRHLRGPFATRLRKELGQVQTSQIVATAEALLAPLRTDRMLANRPAFRAPYVLVSDDFNSLEGVVEMRRVTNVLDALVEVDAMPGATLVIDLYASNVSLLTLAIAAEELPVSAQIVIVGARESERAQFEEASVRPATFVDRFLPLDLRAKTPSTYDAVPAPASLPRAA